MNADATTDGFTVPVDDRYFEDYAAGTTHTYDGLTVTEQDIIDFASQFDPRPSMSTRSRRRTGPSAASWPAAGTPQP